MGKSLTYYKWNSTNAVWLKDLLGESNWWKKAFLVKCSTVLR